MISKQHWLLCRLLCRSNSCNTARWACPKLIRWWLDDLLNRLLWGFFELCLLRLIVVVLDECPSFKRILKVLTANTFAISVAQDSDLETLTVLFKAPRFLARAAFHMMFSLFAVQCCLRLLLGWLRLILRSCLMGRWGLVWLRLYNLARLS